MKVISIIPDVGPGGLTSAVFSRSALLAKSGKDVAVVLYQFMPNYSLDIKEQLNSDRLSSKVKIFNPYEYYSDLYSSLSGYAPEVYPDTHSHITSDDEFIITAHFDNNLNLLSKVFLSIKDRLLIKKQFFQLNSTLYKEEYYFKEDFPKLVKYYSNDSAILEKYLSQNGFCYLRVSIDPNTGTPSGVWSQTDLGEIKFYKNIWDWRREFVGNIVCSHSETNIILCDGNNVPPQFLKLKNKKRAIYPVIHMNHRHLNGDLRRHYSRYFNRLNDFSGLVCLTSEQSEDLLREFDLKIPVYTIPNRINSISVRQLRSSESTVDAIVVSRLENGKGVLDAIKAFEIYASSNPNAQLEIYGTGSNESKLKQYVLECGLSENIHFRGKTLNPLEKISKASLFLFTSESEGFGLTIAEALSVGTPVIAFDCKYGPSNLIVEGKTGYLVGNRSITELAKRLALTIGDRTKVVAMSKEATQWFDENLSDSNIIQYWDDLISKV